MKIIVEIATEVPQWKTYKEINKRLISRIVKNILKSFENLQKIAIIELSLLFTDNNKMLYLNKQFRNKDKTTNVLSFPHLDLDWCNLPMLKPNLNYMYLGDIAFGFNIISIEALKINRSFEHHFIHLLVHSVLHLLGFDHNEEEESKIMEKLEIKILKDFSIDSPY